MNGKHTPANFTRDNRKAYQPLKLVQHGHFMDVVKLSIRSDGSVLEKVPPT
jgi:hypothetical protein